MKEGEGMRRGNGMGWGKGIEDTQKKFFWLRHHSAYNRYKPGTLAQYM